MIILQVKNLSKAYGVQSIFSQLSFTLQEGEKVGLIGPNGTGKSTLLKCITGEEMSDAGEIIVNGNTSIGFVAQQNSWQNNSLFEELLLGFEEIVADRKTLGELEQRMARSEGQPLAALMQQYAQVTERYERAGGYACEAMVKRVAKGLGFTDREFEQTVDTMSGGQKTRAALAKVLLMQPDILLLDEPTNHLDIHAVEWLEEYLSQYPKTVFLVSHDRYFLDKTVTRILELDAGRITSFHENYQGYLRRKAEFAESYRRAYQKQEQVIAKTEEFIRRYKAGVKSKQARGRETILSRMERLEKPPEQKTMRPMTLAPVPECGFYVLEVSKLAHRYGSKRLFSDLNFIITNGEKVALIGDNGTGKSTILKNLIGEILPEEGTAKFGPRVKVGYFSQGHETLDERKTVLEEIIYSFDKRKEEARSLLAAFLFRGDEVEKKIRDLSGGEKSRIALLKLLLQGANFLVLDEPTNHLDIPSKEVVEDYLSDFPGTILVVSHDRYFLDKVANRVLELDGGQIFDFMGNYSYYRFKKKESSTEISLPKGPSKESYRTPNPLKEQERSLKKMVRQIEAIEAQLEELEAEKEALGQKMSNPEVFAGGNEIKDLIQAYHDVEETMNRCYAQWEAWSLEKEELERNLLEQTEGS
ncbi:ABC-F family ATP-binding cassette domain-containing protein [Candidatus Formimonas warabiya]|uniref:ABC-F family ATP-binding cassette domain-containing protein n=1 Tax=Formimonas warabiya TaxID=1761012 RepID=UPI0011D0F28F|nr:ABC-F family ATP-binding cassette domain-containing protein [Candidatus Formimonas warabiya]